MRTYYQLILQGNEINAAEVWLMIKDQPQSSGVLMGNYDIYRENVSTEKIYEYFNKRYSQKRLVLNSGDHRIRFGYHGGCGAYVLNIPYWGGTAVDWISSIKNFGTFLFSRLYEKDYEFCQNTIDATLLDELNLLSKHSITKNVRGVLEVDISFNKGRALVREGYIEAVGSTMWLGDKFFELTGANKEAVKATDWLEVTEDSPGVLKIVAQDNPFTSDQGEEGELQDKMRDLLFPGHS